MRADLSKIVIVRSARDATGKERPFNPAIDMPSLAAKAINLGDVTLLVIDPVVAAIPTAKNSHNNAETRNGLQPVIDFAEATGCGVLGITHFTKGTSGQDPIERVTGSLAFGALPRLVWAAAKNHASDDGSMPRIFVHAKSNLGPSGGGFGYDIDAAPHTSVRTSSRLELSGSVRWKEPRRNCSPKQSRKRKTNQREKQPKRSSKPRCHPARSGRKRK
jgi:putative DNA primase/helicase